MILENSFLNEATRSRNLARIGRASRRDPLDLLIAGGGVTGLGAALDAAARGLRVGLVEQGDYASGTSSASSRLAHGGLRYLEQGHVRLVREALGERHLLVTRTAPHLTRRLDFLFPARTSAQLPYYRAGVAVYDVLARAAGGRLPGAPSRLIRTRELRRIAPGLDVRGMSGAIRFADAQIDDARFAVALARTAQAEGASVANYARLASVAEVRDEPIRCTIDTDGAQFDTWARTVLLACGPWTNGWSGALARRPLVRLSKGTHIVVPRSAIDLDVAVLSRTPSSVLFVLPWRDTWIIGTTDDDYRGAPDSVGADEGEIDYIVAQANRILRIPISRDDVTATYAGLRPLPAGSRAAATTRVSREHVIEEVGPRVFSIFGGKYTTYRIMAKDAVDAVCASLARSDLACTTDRIPLVGAQDTSGRRRPDSLSTLAEHGAAGAQRRARFGTEAEDDLALLARYGTEAEDILATTTGRPQTLTPVPDLHGYRLIDVEQAFTREGARTVDDVIARRLRLTTEGTAAAERARPVVERIAIEVRAR